MNKLVGLALFDAIDQDLKLIHSEFYPKGSVEWDAAWARVKANLNRMYQGLQSLPTWVASSKPQ